MEVILDRLVILILIAKIESKFFKISSIINQDITTFFSLSKSIC